MGNKIEKNNIIKTCPFCGSDAELDNFNPEKEQWVVCCENEECIMYVGWNCEELGVDTQTQEQAIEKWNKRR